MTKLEQIARAIEPGAFEQFNSLRTYCLRQGDSEEEAARTAEWAHGHDVRRALEKARAAVEAMRSEHDVETLMRGAGAIATFNIETDGPAKPHEACSTPDEWMMRGANIAKRMVSGQEAARCFNAMIDSILNERGG